MNLWGWGIGYWGLGIAQSPIPNPQTLYILIKINITFFIIKNTFKINIKFIKFFITINIISNTIKENIIVILSYNLLFYYLFKVLLQLRSKA